MAPHSEAGVGGAAHPTEEAAEAPAWERGIVVQLCGLVNRPELNETSGLVVQFDGARRRYAATVKLLDSKPILVKPTNLRPWSPNTTVSSISAAVEPTALGRVWGAPADEGGNLGVGEAEKGRESRTDQRRLLRTTRC